MTKARYIQAGETIDYRPDANVRAGDVIVFGDRALVTKLDIAAGTLGALATVGVFDVIKPASTFAAGDLVDWHPYVQSLGSPATDGGVVPRYSGYVLMGHVVQAASESDKLVRVALAWGQGPAGPQGPQGPEGPSWIPYPPGSGFWVLKAINGTVQWVEESWSSSA